MHVDHRAEKAESMSAVSERGKAVRSDHTLSERLLVETQGDWLAIAVCAVTAGVAVLAALAFITLALQWREQPFIGAQLTHTLVVSGSEPMRPDTWTGLTAGLQRSDRLIGLNGVSLSEVPTDYPSMLITYRDLLAGLNMGETAELQVARQVAAGDSLADNCTLVGDSLAQCTFSVGLIAYPAADFLASFVIPLISSLAVLAAGLVILWRRWQQPNGRLVALVCLLMSIVIGGLFDLNTTFQLVPLWLAATCLLGGALAMLALNFPNKLAVLYRYNWLEYTPIGIGVAIALLVNWFYFIPPSAEFALRNTFIAVSTGLAGLLILAAAVVYKRRVAVSPLLRDQNNAVLIGLALAAVPVVVWIISYFTQTYTPFQAFAFNAQIASPFLILVPLSLMYAVFQQSWVDTDWLISQGITYSIMLLALVLGYFLLVLGVTLVINDTLRPNDPMLIALTVFIVAILFLPVRSRLQQVVDEIYFRARRNYQQQLDQFSDRLTNLVTFDDIMAELRQQLEQAIAPKQIFIFTPAGEGREFAEASTPPATQVRFDAESEFIQLLQRADSLIYLEPGKPRPAQVLVENTRLRILDATIIIGLKGRDNRLNAIVTISQPLSGMGTYSYEDLRFVRNIVRQVSIAAERAQVVTSLERRVHELDVLSKVSQAANFTVSFDDLLELISAQTSRLIDLSHLYIVLYDQRLNENYFAFFLENDERYRDRESLRWRAGRDLYSEIIQSSKSINTANYQTAMKARGYLLEREDPEMRAWMGRPLITGTSTLGVIAVGTTDPDRIFTDDHMRIFTDISTLAATSLDKARLVEETISRARQLAALNDISQKLVATESDIDQLLRIITASAVDILAAEAGSLLLTVDDESNDLEFKVAVGGSGAELIGSKIPAGRGLVGEVASKGRMVIVNDAMNDPRWGGELSPKGGFSTNSILAVPLTTQSRVIGVLEVLNKRGGLFSDDDAELLSTFAGQAAIAIENARLFQMTDFKLRERVAELEMLERMDIELNRSLDLEKVAEITVRYAMQQSGATAGVLGMVSPDGRQLYIAAHRGYDPVHDFADGDTGVWSLEKGIINRVMRTRLPDLTTDTSVDNDYIQSLRGAKSQLTVPIMSGGEIIAILVLESTLDLGLSLAHMAFVQRVAEHASIAISNALLLRELNLANQSKSEFVSFVAHELKNPLTSIKGYSDFLLNPALGQLSEQQRNFLYTIRFNADRMNTLVSDLNDITKLQTNNLRIELAPIKFRKVVTETLRPLQKQIEDKQQDLIIDVLDTLPEINADENRLIQVLTNLVSNAHKYSPPGGIITISAGVVSNRRDDRGRLLPPALQIMVQDTGIGMSEEDLMRLFTPYFRSDNPLAREQPGTGLGLTITRGLIERHGGDVWVTSTLGKGTAFYFTIPLAVQPQVGD
jgi:signal transduction histidine kinase